MLSIREYLEAGETTISNLLFDHYQKIGLKDDEFLFYCNFFVRKMQAIYFQT